MHATATLETVHFRLRPGAEPAALLAAAAATAAPLAARPGFLDRRLIRRDDGGWTDLVAWADPASATAAAEAMMADPAFGAFLALIDPEGMEIRHDPIAWSMP